MSDPEARKPEVPATSDPSLEPQRVVSSGASSGVSAGASPLGPRPALVPMVVGWLVPGAGHLMIGRTWPGLFVAAAVFSLFFGGMALAGWTNVDPEKHRWYFIAQISAGGPTLGAWLATKGRELTEFRPHLTVGELYTAIAGLLNLVAVADVRTRCLIGDPEVPPVEPETPEAPRA